MKTKREILKYIADHGSCNIVNCKDCPYDDTEHCSKSDLRKIGAMAILRMFPEKEKKPLLSIGTKVRFNDGSIAKIESTTAGPELSFSTINGYTSRPLSYLLDRTWEVIE